MKYITLQSNETVLYEGGVTIAGDQLRNVVFLSASVQLILTNVNIYFEHITKKMFAKEQVTVEQYSVDEIKVYDGTPQIKVSGCDVELYFTSGEIKVKFASGFEAHKFANAVNKLVTGKSAAARGADKVKGAVNLVNDTLGIDTVNTVKNVLENGIARTVLGGFGKKKHSKSSLVKNIADISTELLDEPQSNVENQSVQDVNVYNQQLEITQKLKDLLDAGILTQDEFDAKKKEILGL